MKFPKKQRKIILIIVLILIVGSVFVMVLQHPNLLKRSPIESVRQVIDTVSGTSQAGLPSAAQLQNKDAVLLEIPFTVQAPFGEWSDPRQQEACEEASVLMAMHWVKNEPIASKQAAKDEILAISHYESDRFGDYHDTSIADTAKWIIAGFYQYNNYQIKPVVGADDIVGELAAGHVVIVPTNGRALNNKYFTQPGPERHMLVVKGFDRIKQQFITDEPGISQGENWRYDKDLLFKAIRDYATGDHAPIVGDIRVMIVIKR